MAQEMINRPIVLVVDDSHECIDFVKVILGDDYRIKATTSGAQALLVAVQEPQPDLILLDISMPEIDGFAVCGRLKENPRTWAIPVLFLTGSNNDFNEPKGFMVGGVDYVKKPFSPLVLKARVATHIALYQQERFLEAQVLQRTQALKATRAEILIQLHNSLALGQVDKARKNIETWAENFGIPLADELGG